eukprot:6053053-Lingulodinium_polyedra.AAC.1
MLPRRQGFRPPRAPETAQQSAGRPPSRATASREATASTCVEVRSPRWATEASSGWPTGWCWPLLRPGLWSPWRLRATTSGRSPWASSGVGVDSGPSPRPCCASRRPRRQVGRCMDRAPPSGCWKPFGTRAGLRRSGTS